MPSNDQLIAAQHSTEEIRKMIGADSLGYMQIDYLEGMAGGDFRCAKHVLMAINRWKYRQKSNRINKLCGINLTVKNNGLKNKNVKTTQ